MTPPHFRSINRQAVGCAAALAILTAWAPSAAGAVDVPWSSFVLQGSRLGSAATAEVELEVLPAAVETPTFGDSPMGSPLEPAGAQVHKLSVVITLDILGGGRVRLENHLWFDPGSNTPLYLIRTRVGLKNYHQRFRFTREGVFRRQREPASAREIDAAPESWTRLGENFYPYPADRRGCPLIIETSQLILLAGAPIPEPGEIAGPICLFHKRHAHQVSVHGQPAQKIRFDYLEKRGDSEHRRVGGESALSVRIASRPLGSYRGDVEDFFRAGGQFWLDPEGRWPLVVSGELPLVGRVEMRLKQLRLK
jgi:hypothetical protein